MNYPIDKIVSRSQGSGEPPVLLLHGWGCNENTMNALSVPLSAHRRTISLALPGFGNSPEPLEPWGSKEYADTIVNWIEKEGLKKVELIGHSHGGRVAIQIAAMKPELVDRLVLIGSAGLPPRRSLKIKLRIHYGRLLRSVAGIIGGEFAKRVEEQRQKLGSEDWKAASPMMRKILSRVIPEDLSHEMALIQAPTLLVWGRNDTATPIGIGERMKQLIGNSRLIVIEGAGHYVFLEKTGEVISQIWDHFGLSKAW